MPCSASEHNGAAAPWPARGSAAAVSTTGADSPAVFRPLPSLAQPLQRAQELGHGSPTRRLLSETESGLAPAGTSTGGEVSILIDGSPSRGKVTRFRVSRTSMCAAPLRAWCDEETADAATMEARVHQLPVHSCWMEPSCVAGVSGTDTPVKCCVHELHAAQGLSWQGHQAPGGGGPARSGGAACAGGWRSAGGPQQLDGQPHAGGRCHAARCAQSVPRQPEPPSMLTCSVT
jgi:hypothetical protein